MLSRRTVIGGMAAGAAWPGLALGQAMPLGAGATVAWASLDRGTGRRAGVNVDARMPICSTFKWLLAAHVLWRVDRGQERLERPIAFGRADLLEYAPIVRGALGRRERATLTVGALCEGTVTLSDNAAANLLLPSVGGPAGLTRWMRSLGDGVTRLDRTEPALNRVPPGDPRDTTSAAAMLGDLDRLLFGPVLRPASRRRLMEWLLGCKTGDTRLRAGLPAGWRIGHKTGTYTTDTPTRIDRNAAGDVGVLLSPGRAPILIAAYTVGSVRPPAEVDRWFADVARRVTRSVPRQN